MVKDIECINSITLQSLHATHITAVFLLADYRLPVLAPDVVELGAVVVEGDVEGGDTPLLVTTVRLRAVHAVD